MEKFELMPLSADEVIAELEKKGRRRLSRNIEIMVRILSKKPLFPFELVAQMKSNPDYSCRGSDDNKLIQRMQTLRHHNVLGRLDGWYFIKGTIADPKIKNHVDEIKSWINQSKEKNEVTRSLRSIAYEILQKEPLPVRRLVMAIEIHPDYDGAWGSGQALLSVMNCTLNNRKNKQCFFERRKERRKYDLWQVKPGSFLPPNGYCQNPSPQRDKLYRLMQSKFIIKGWSLLDLYDEVIKPDSCYEVKSGSSPELVMSALRRVLDRGGDEYFELILREGEIKHWRARCLITPKIPSCTEDFFDLTSKVLDDIVFTLSLERLLRIIRRYGYLFGYQVSELPESFLQIGITRAITGTKYLNQVR